MLRADGDDLLGARDEIYRFGSSPCFKERFEGNPFDFSSARLRMNFPDDESRWTVVALKPLSFEDLVCDIKASAHGTDRDGDEQENVSSIETRLSNVVRDGVRVRRFNYTVTKEFVELGANRPILAKLLEFCQPWQEIVTADVI